MLPVMVALPVPTRVKSAMQRFYRDGGQAFFRALDKDAAAAVLAFRQHPRGIAPLHFFFEWSPLLMEAEQRRINVLLDEFLARLRAGDANASQAGTERQ